MLTNAQLCFIGVYLLTTGFSFHENVVQKLFLFRRVPERFDQNVLVLVGTEKVFAKVTTQGWAIPRVLTRGIAYP